jgi:4a-hydroxytetrahydrobiopterin dehydratase
MTDLLQKTCVPCRGGLPPLAGTEAERYLREAPGWALIDDGKRIERKFTFKNFEEALAFVNRVGSLAEDEGHHPDITFGWGYATISLYTHKIKGLHENDFIMAAKINRLFD